MLDTIVLMVLLCVASRVTCLFCMFLSAILTLFLTQISSTFLTYDHQTLLNIGNQVYYLLDAIVEWILYLPAAVHL